MEWNAEQYPHNPPKPRSYKLPGSTSFIDAPGLYYLLPTNFITLISIKTLEIPEN